MFAKYESRKSNKVRMTALYRVMMSDITWTQARVL